jgi:hypothetical protein
MGTRKQFHDKDCCSNHDHHINSKDEKPIKTHPNLTGFTPEPNKTYE